MVWIYVITKVWSASTDALALLLYFENCFLVSTVSPRAKNKHTVNTIAPVQSRRNQYRVEKK